MASISRSAKFVAILAWKLHHDSDPAAIQGVRETGVAAPLRGYVHNTPKLEDGPMAGGQPNSPRRFGVTRSVLDGRVSVVAVTGEVDVWTAPDFQDALTAAVMDEETDGIVVDLSGVSFLDSTALNALVRCFEQQKARLQGLSLVSDDSRVTSLLEVPRLDRLLEVFPTSDEAIARVRR